MKFLSLALILFLIAACDPDAKAAKGFSLPEGDPAIGKNVFKAMQCNNCHSIEGVEQVALSEDQVISVKLGGQVTRIKTYGELVTSVINPSHRIAHIYKPENTDSEGNSTMRNYNEIMTVDQLIDLVSFLQSKYELKPYDASEYRAYYP